MSTNEDTPEIEVNRAIDCSGKRCPMPIYMASKTLAKMEPGQILEVTCTDASSIRDFPGFAEKAGHRLVATRQPEGKVYVFFLQKGEA